MKKIKYAISNEEFDNIDSVSNVTTDNNNIYFYDDVNKNSILELRKNIYKVSIEQKKMKLIYPTFEPRIYLHINTDGGFLTDGLSIIDCIENNDVPIETIIEGISASAGTLLSVAGHYRKIQKYSVMLVHQIRSGVVGKQADLEDENENNKLYESKMLEFYERRTKLSKKELKEMMKNERIIDSKDALKYGFVDEII